MSEPFLKGYRVIAVSLGLQELAEAEQIATRLRDVGWPHSNRSMVVREGVRDIVELLRGKTAEELFRCFVERQRRRAAQRSARPPSAA